jgi:hypothetical protein
MPSIAPFNSVNEAIKPVAQRVYHNNGACPSGRDIPRREQRTGTAGYTLCDHCKNLNKQGR